MAIVSLHKSPGTAHVMGLTVRSDCRPSYEVMLILVSNNPDKQLICLHEEVEL